MRRLVEKYGKRRHSTASEDLIGNDILKPLEEWKRQTDQLLMHDTAAKRPKVMPFVPPRQLIPDEKEKLSQETKQALQALRRELTEKHEVEKQNIHKKYSEDVLRLEAKLDINEEQVNLLQQKLQEKTQEIKEKEQQIEAMKVKSQLRRSYAKEKMSATIHMYEKEKQEAAARYRVLELRLFNQTEATDKAQAELQQRKKQFEDMLMGIRQAALSLGLPVPPADAPIFVDDL